MLNLLEVTAGFVGGAIAMALLLGQVYAWIERRRAQLVGGVA